MEMRLRVAPGAFSSAHEVVLPVSAGRMQRVFILASVARGQSLIDAVGRFIL